MFNYQIRGETRPDPDDARNEKDFDYQGLEVFNLWVD